MIVDMKKVIIVIRFRYGCLNDSELVSMIVSFIFLVFMLLFCYDELREK